MRYPWQYLKTRLENHKKKKFYWRSALTEEWISYPTNRPFSGSSAVHLQYQFTPGFFELGILLSRSFWCGSWVQLMHSLSLAPSWHLITGRSSVYKHSHVPGSTNQADLQVPKATSYQCFLVLDALLGFKGQLHFENTVI